MTILVYRCTLPSGSYIGITSQKLKTRIYQHTWLSEKDKPRLNFHRALKREGDKAVWTVIAQVLDWKTACLMEQDLILGLGTAKIGVGFNLTLGGDGGYGVKYTEERKKVMSIRMTGRKMSEEAKRRLSKSKLECFHPLRGIKMPTEWKEKIRISGIGRKNTLETKNKMSISGLKRFRNNPINLFDVWDKDGKHVGRWKNIRECSESIGIKQSGIGNCLCGIAVSHCGYKFKRINDISPTRIQSRETKEKRSEIIKKIWENKNKTLPYFIVFNKEGKFIGKWNNQHKCADDLGLKQGRINECLRNSLKHKSHRGYIFKRDYNAPSASTPSV